MSPYVALFFDIVVIAALGITIFYCWRLSRQFNQMRADRKAFETLIQGLNVASSRAEASIKSFKETAVGSGDILQDKINRSKAISEELEIMIEAGNSLADRLQAQAEKSRKAASGEDTDRPSRPQEIQPRTKAEKELLDALKAKQQS